MILGRDSRVTGGWIEQVVQGLLIASGYIVINVGVVPTPTVTSGASNDSLPNNYLGPGYGTARESCRWNCDYK